MIYSMYIYIISHSYNLGICIYIYVSLSLIIYYYHWWFSTISANPPALRLPTSGFGHRFGVLTIDMTFAFDSRWGPGPVTANSPSMHHLYIVATTTYNQKLIMCIYIWVRTPDPWPPPQWYGPPSSRSREPGTPRNDHCPPRPAKH